MDGSIASPHWQACYSCRNHGPCGCELDDIDLILDGDDILCDQYENIKERKND